MAGSINSPQAGELPVILLALDADRGNLILKSYIYANGEILMQYNGNHTADKYFYLHDRLCSVREVIDANGTVKNHYTYKPFGEILTAETAENPFKFTGQYYDSEIGQYYLRARQYDPQLMRFTARDPVLGQFEEPITLHKYLYCGNEPVNRIDPVGLWYTTVHNQIIDLAFGGNNSWGQIQNYDIKRGSAYVDSPQFCDSEHAYMHAMRPAWQTEEVVMTDGGPMIVSHMNSLSKQETIDKMIGFIISELEQSNCNNEIGYTRLAGFHLGEAAHPLMDFMCPAHDLKPWAGGLPEYAPHFRDIWPFATNRQMRDTATFTRTTLEMLNNDTQALSGWDW
jgi:RHS repeat-associated protein